MTASAPSDAPFFSIVVPTYNRRELLAATLESVARQDDGDFECIVVDDGGSDDSGSLDAFRDRRFRYVWKQNEERGIARNHGTGLARGRYVYYLDSDDRLTTDHLSHARECIARWSTPAVLHSRFVHVDAHGRTLWRASYPRDLQRALLRRNLVGSYLFVRRDVAVANPFAADPRFSIAEDWFHALVLSSKFPIHVTDRATRLIVLHPGQSMRGHRATVARSAERMSAHLRAAGRFDASTIRGVEAEMQTLFALHAALEGELTEAVAAEMRALSLRPSVLVDWRTAAIVKHCALAVARRLGAAG